MRVRGRSLELVEEDLDALRILRNDRAVSDTAAGALGALPQARRRLSPVEMSITVEHGDSGTLGRSAGEQRVGHRDTRRRQLRDDARTLLPAASASNRGARQSNALPRGPGLRSPTRPASAASSSVRLVTSASGVARCWGEKEKDAGASNDHCSGARASARDSSFSPATIGLLFAKMGLAAHWPRWLRALAFGLHWAMQTVEVDYCTEAASIISREPRRADPPSGGLSRTLVLRLHCRW